MVENYSSNSNKLSKRAFVSADFLENQSKFTFWKNMRHYVFDVTIAVFSGPH